MFLWLALAIAGIFLWQRFALPRFQAIDLSVNQFQAVDIAKRFLTVSRGFNVREYHTAAVFDVDEDADRYLQKTLGTASSQRLVDRLQYDLFSWVVRFFKEQQKEEFKVIVSSKTGEVIGFFHDIEDTAMRAPVDKEKARQSALDFLKQQSGFDPARHALHREDAKKFDNRMDYTFSWEAKGIDIPWDKKYGGGNARLLTTVVVSGDEVRSFDKFRLDIPEGFGRTIDNLKQTGQNLTLVFRLLYLGLLTIAIMMVVNRKHHIIPRMVKPFYVRIGVGFFLLMVVEALNGHQYLLFEYPTSRSFFDYVLREFLQGLISPFFIALGFILPALAGESLRFEIAPGHKAGGFLSPVLSSFYSRPVAKQICVGYAFAAFILGAQALVFEAGRRYCGVWDELSWLTQASTHMFPALTVFLIGFQASFSEEIMFRLFAVYLLRKYGLAGIGAVVVSAVMWGFGHTGYAIFPMWFRGLEVSCLGIILGVAYLRYGLVTVITAHFLMDSFLGALPYLLRPRVSFDFCSALMVIALPFLLAGIAFVRNKSVRERPWVARFTPQQQFNYGLLAELCRAKTDGQLKIFKQDLVRHGWDPVVVGRAFLDRP